MDALPKLSNEDQLAVFAYVKEGLSMDDAIAKVQSRGSAAPGPCHPAVAAAAAAAAASSSSPGKAGSGAALLSPDAAAEGPAVNASVALPSLSNEGQIAVFNLVKEGIDMEVALRLVQHQIAAGMLDTAPPPKSPNAKRSGKIKNPLKHGKKAKPTSRTHVASSSPAVTLSNENQIVFFNMVKKGATAEEALAIVQRGGKEQIDSVGSGIIQTQRPELTMPKLTNEEQLLVFQMVKEGKTQEEAIGLARKEASKPKRLQGRRAMSAGAVSGLKKHVKKKEVPKVSLHLNPFDSEAPPETAASAPSPVDKPPTWVGFDGQAEQAASSLPRSQSVPAQLDPGHQDPLAENPFLGAAAPGELLDLLAGATDPGLPAADLRGTAPGDLLDLLAGPGGPDDGEDEEPPFEDEFTTAPSTPIRDSSPSQPSLSPLNNTLSEVVEEDSQVTPEVKQKLINRLREENVKLWLPPFTTEDGESDIPMDFLMELADDFELDFLVVADTIEDIRVQTVAKKKSKGKQTEPAPAFPPTPAAADAQGEGDGEDEDGDEDAEAENLRLALEAEELAVEAELRKLEQEASLEAERKEAAEAAEAAAAAAAQAREEEEARAAAAAAAEAAARAEADAAAAVEAEKAKAAAAAEAEEARKAAKAAAKAAKRKQLEEDLARKTGQLAAEKAAAEDKARAAAEAAEAAGEARQQELAAQEQAEREEREAAAKKAAEEAEAEAAQLAEMEALERELEALEAEKASAAAAEAKKAAAKKEKAERLAEERAARAAAEEAAQRDADKLKAKFAQQRAKEEAAAEEAEAAAAAAVAEEAQAAADAAAAAAAVVEEEKQEEAAGEGEPDVQDTAATAAASTKAAGKTGDSPKKKKTKKVVKKVVRKVKKAKGAKAAAATAAGGAATKESASSSPAGSPDKATPSTKSPGRKKLTLKALDGSDEPTAGKAAGKGRLKKLSSGAAAFLQNDAMSRTSSKGSDGFVTPLTSPVHHSKPDAITDWVNELENTSFGGFDELEEGAKDGVLLCTLLGTLAPDALDLRCINKKNLDDPEQVEENLTLFLMTMQSEGCFVGDVTAADLVARKKGALMKTLKQLHDRYAKARPGKTRRSTFSGPPPASSTSPQRTMRRSVSSTSTNRLSKKESALAWCQDLSEGKFEVTNFSSCFANGLAFCAVLHGLYPEEVPFADLSADQEEENFTLAFEVAEKHGVAPLLDVEDMVEMQVPDARSVMTYVFEMHRILGRPL